MVPRKQGDAAALALRLQQLLAEREEAQTPLCIFRLFPSARQIQRTDDQSAILLQISTDRLAR